MGSDQLSEVWDSLIDKFQSTLPHGERRHEFRQLMFYIQFQSTLPHGERHSAVYFRPMKLMFQSTLPHGERLDRGLPSELIRGVSIHAPTWGATFDRFRRKRAEGFNPRSHMGSDFKLY